MPKAGDRARYRWAFAASLAVVLVLALVPQPAYLPSTGWDKAIHALVFAGLAVLGCLAYPRRLPVLLPGLLAFGASIELLQGLTAYRTAEWLDLLADAVGLALAAWPCSLALRRHLA